MFTGSTYNNAQQRTQNNNINQQFNSFSSISNSPKT